MPFLIELRIFLKNMNFQPRCQQLSIEIKLSKLWQVIKKTSIEIESNLQWLRIWGYLSPRWLQFNQKLLNKSGTRASRYRFQIHHYFSKKQSNWTKVGTIDFQVLNLFQFDIYSCLRCTCSKLIDQFKSLTSCPHKTPST